MTNFLIRSFRDSDIDDLYHLLLNHYIEDSTIKMIYDKQCLINEFCNNKSLLLFIDETNLIGCLSSQECTICVNHIPHVVEKVNFLCIHKNFRNKKYRILLQTELSKLSSCGKFIFTTSSTSKFVSPEDNYFLSCQYYHKILNIKKLIKFGYYDHNKKLLHIYKEIKHPVIQSSIIFPSIYDIPSIIDLFHNEYSNNSTNIILYEHISKDLLQKLIDNNGKSYFSFITKLKGKISSFISFYLFDTLIVRSKKIFKTAGIYYHAGVTKNHDEFLNNIFQFLRENGIAMINCLNNYSNTFIIDKHSFVPGTGKLEYNYILNDKSFPFIKDLNPSKENVALTLI